MWVSQDIWVRNQPDGFTNTTQENPINGQANYVYVHVRNRGCEASIGVEQLKAYWAKASTALIWPDSWNGLHHFPIPPYFPLEGDILTPNPSSLTPRVFINNSTGTPIITNATYNSGTSSITIPVIQSFY